MNVERFDDDGVTSVVFSGPFDGNAMVDAIMSVPIAPDDVDDIGSIIDLRAVDELEFDPVAFAGIARAVHRRFPRPGSYRYAILAGDEEQRSLAEWMGVTRDVTVVGSGPLPEIQAFTSVDEALRWVRRDD
ncbi:MAG: hypothetical protein AAF081_08210 [Actinomycetota bacterium]